MDYKEASKIVADVNDMLQQEIDRIMANEGQEEIRQLEEGTLASEVAEEVAPDVEDLPEITLPEDLQDMIADTKTDAPVMEIEEEVPEMTDDAAVEELSLIHIFSLDLTIIVMILPESSCMQST